MNIHDIDPTTARRATATGRSRRWTARATAAAAAALAGGAAVVGSAGSAEAQEPVQLAAAVAVKAAANQGHCAKDLELLKVSETVKMIVPPTSAKDVENADDNGDRYVCVGMPAGGRHPNHFEDNWYAKSGGGGCDDSGMNNGGGMGNGCGGMNGDEEEHTENGGQNGTTSSGSGQDAGGSMDGGEDGGDAE